VKKSTVIQRIESQYERDFAVNVIREILVTVNHREFSRLKVIFPSLFNYALKRLMFMPGLKKQKYCFILLSATTSSGLRSNTLSPR